jgi:hypothetical protein
MGGPVRALLHGVTDASQIEEACQLGLDGIVVDLRPEAGPACVTEAEARRLARHVAPLTARLALLADGAALPETWPGAVTGPAAPRPPGAGVHVVRAVQEGLSPADLPVGADLVWLRPRAERAGAGAAFDFDLVERIGRRHPLLLEVPDGAAGVEVAIRLGRPLGVVLGEGVWVQPGIVDLDRLEAALGVVARLNKAALDR